MKKHWLVSLLAVTLMVCVVFGIMGTVAFATINGATAYSNEGITITEGGEATWTITKGATSGTIGIAVDMALFGNRSGTLYLTNDNTVPVRVYFKYPTTFDASATLDITTTSTSTVTNSNGVFETLLGVGEKITLVMTEKAFASTTLNATITDLLIVPASADAVTLLTPENGTYTISTTNADTGTSSATPEDGTFSFVSTDGLTLTATADSGYQFNGWLVNGEVVSSANPLNTKTDTSISIQAGDEISAQFILDDYTLVYDVGPEQFYNWSSAVAAAAASNGVHPVVLNQSYALPSTKTEADAVVETYEHVTVDGNTLIYDLPAGVTFVIPYDSTLSTTHDVAIRSNQPVAGSGAYVLTVPEGVSLNVSGNLVVNAKQHAGYQGSANIAVQGTTTGTYGKMILGGTLTVQNGGTLDARGYIVDVNHKSGHTFGQSKGKVYAKSGSTVNVFFQIMNHRGGSSTLTTLNKTMPITVYYIQNIMLYTEYEAGSVMNGYYALWIDGDVIRDKTVLLSDSSGLFVMQSGSVVAMDYDYTNDRMIVNLKTGTIDLKSVSLTLPTGIGTSTATVDTKNSALPLSDNIQIYIGEYGNTTHSEAVATANLTYPIKLLPGATINVMGNGKLNIPNTGALYMYAGADYTASWSAGFYRKRLNIDEVNGAGTQPAYSGMNPAVNVYGTVESAATILQSPSITAGIQPAGEGAVYKTDLNATSGSVKEHLGFEKSGHPDVENWEAIDGLFADVSASTSDYIKFSDERVGTGTYKAAEIDGEHYWYKHSVTYTYTDVDNNKVEKMDYIVGDTTTLAAADLVINDQKYVITGYTIDKPDGVTAAGKNTEGNLDPNSADVSKGWENLTLSGISQDIVVTLTVKPYDYKAAWTVTGDTDKNRTDYLLSGVDSVTTWTGDNSIAFDVSITPMEGTGTTAKSVATYNDTAGAESSTLTITNIDKDINVAVTLSMDAVKITWEVTDPYGNDVSPDPVFVAKDGSKTYTIVQPQDGWYIVENDDDITVTGAATVVNNKESVTVSNPTENVVVKIDLTAFDCKVQLTTGSDTTEDVEIKPIYVNFVASGTDVVITSDDISSESTRYIFEAVNSVSPEGTTYELNEYKDTLTIKNVTSRVTTMTVTLKSYDHCVTIREKSDSTKIYSKQYITGNAAETYTFAEGIAISVDAGSITTAVVDATNATPEACAAIAVTNVKEDTVVPVETTAFDHIVTFVDAQTGETLGQHFVKTGAKVNYTCPATGTRYYVKAAEITTGGGTLSGVGTEAISITDLSGNPTVKVTRQEFLYKVTWIDASNDETLETDYLGTGETSADYQCADKVVAKVNSSNATSTQFAETTGEIIHINDVEKNLTVKLDLYSYEYKVQFVTGETVKKTVYVKNDKSVVDNGSVFIRAYKPDYFTGYTLTGAATVDGSENTNASVADGWEVVKLTGIGSDVTVDLTMGTYQYKVTWTVETTLNDETSTNVKANYINTDMDSYELAKEYSIQSIESTGGTAEGVNTNKATITGIDKDIQVTVDARDFVYTITWNWIIKGGEGEEDQTGTYSQNVKTDEVDENGYVSWSMSDYVTEGSYVVVKAEVSGGEGTHTNKIVKVKRSESNENDVTVDIEIEKALTNYTALFGKMNYRYYKTGAFYSKVEDGNSYQWKLIETYAWTHKAGSMLHSYADEKYVVPNGSVMLVNPTNQIVVATVTVTTDKDWLNVTLQTEDGSIVSTTENGVTTIQITLAPTTADSDEISRIIVDGLLEGDPPEGENLDEFEVGSWSVTIKPLD